MKLKLTPNLNQSAKNQSRSLKNEKSSKVGFGHGEALTLALTYLQTNQGLGASFVDAGFMCTPRTLVDFSRGPAAGLETARREFSSNINDGLLGAYGLGAAWILSQGFNNKFGVQAHKMPVDKDMMETLSEYRYKHGDLNEPDNLKSFLNDVLDHTKGLNPNVEGKGTDWVHIGDDSKTAIINRLSTELPDSAKKSKAQYKEMKSHLKFLIVNATGSENDIAIEKAFKNVDPNTGEEVLKQSVSTVDDYIDDIFRVSKSFMSEKVSKVFGTAKLTDPKAIADAITQNHFIKEFDGLKLGTAALGIAACSVVGASVQPINMYLTKKKTGQTGFVGGGEENKTTSFKFLKAGVAAAAGTALLRTIGKFNEIPTKIQFKGIWPTIPQFKFVYAITIISRLLSARNENEVRESIVKDSLGFMNWLILGGFASKLAAMGLEKVVKFREGSGVDSKFIKYKADEHVIEKGLFKGKHVPRWLAGSIVSREEVLHETLKKANLLKDGKTLDFKSMLKLAADKLPEARAKTRYLGVIQAVGYLWSALALGIATPKINIAITKAVEKAKAAKAANSEPQQDNKVAA